MKAKAFFLAALTGASVAAAQQQPAQSRPNVLMIVADDLNDWAGVPNGGPITAQTPNIDRLMARGVTFTNAHCVAPLCAPSRAALWTGMAPSTTGYYGQIDDKYLRTEGSVASDAVYLSEWFANNDYTTAAAGKLFHLGGGPTGAFQNYGGEFGGFGPKPPQRFVWKKKGTQTDWAAFPERDDQMPDDKVADWAVKQLAEKHDQPFFMAVGFWRPHVPWYVPKKWFDRYDAAALPMPPYKPDDQADIPEIGRRVHEVPPMPTTEWAIANNQWRNMVHAYLACVTFADYQVGRVLDALEKSGQIQNTIIVFWSDHGYHLGEKNRFAKHSLWERSTHVPMVIVGPGLPAGQRCRQPISLLDLYPTLVSLSGLPANPRAQGHDLSPLLRDANASWPHAAVTTYGRGNHAVRDERYRYIRYANGEEELYDHDSDPNEWDNLAATPESRQRHRAIIDRLAAHLPAADAPEHPHSTNDVNDYFRAGLPAATTAPASTRP